MDDYEVIVNRLGRLIRQARGALDNERTAPSRGSDQSDHFIQQEQARVQGLTKIREDFEALECSTSELRP